MKIASIIIASLFLLPAMSHFNFHSKIEIKIEPHEIKTLTFPLGTKIRVLGGDNIIIHKSGGIKNGKHLLFSQYIFQQKREDKIIL